VIVRLCRLTLFALILSIPLQTGLHFWPDFSKISGIRVDYLSPTLYVTDVLIVLIIVLTFLHLLKNHFSVSHWVSAHQNEAVFIGILIVILAISTFLSRSPEAALYGSFKYLEFLLFGYSLSYILKRKDISTIMACLAAGALSVSLLTLAQFYFQSSIGGLFYFFGERSFSPSTPGIALFNIHDTTLLRPYATFAHPNLLAFYLFMTNIFLLMYIRTRQLSGKSIVFLAITILSSVALFLTFSRVILVLYGAFLVYYLWNLAQNRLKILALLFVCALIGTYLSFYSDRFFSEQFLVRDSMFRFDLFSIGLDIFTKNWLFGTGAKNFFVHASSYFHTFSPIFLQPVHNAYALWFVELGIGGGVLGILFLVKSLKRIGTYISLKQDKFSISLVWTFLGILIVSFIDHFFITLQQGLLMGSIVLGLIWIRK
jgi:hypothetical protein